MKMNVYWSTNSQRTLRSRSQWLTQHALWVRASINIHLHQTTRLLIFGASALTVKSIVRCLGWCTAWHNWVTDWYWWPDLSGDGWHNRWLDGWHDTWRDRARWPNGCPQRQRHCPHKQRLVTQRLATTCATSYAQNCHRETHPYLTSGHVTHE